jgi:hypothetical protein
LCLGWAAEYAASELPWHAYVLGWKAVACCSSGLHLRRRPFVKALCVRATAGVLAGQVWAARQAAVEQWCFISETCCLQQGRLSGLTVVAMLPERRAVRVQQRVILRAKALCRRQSRTSLSTLGVSFESYTSAALWSQGENAVLPGRATTSSLASFPHWRRRLLRSRLVVVMLVPYHGCFDRCDNHVAEGRKGVASSRLW